MSEPPQPRPAPSAPPPSPPTLGMGNTPNAEKYVLEADAMRRRQLRSALLHGSSRTWREHGRVWPAVAVGIVLAAVIIAGLAVRRAVQTEDKGNQPPTRSATQPPSSPRATASPPSSSPPSSP